MLDKFIVKGQRLQTRLAETQWQLGNLANRFIREHPSESVSRLAEGLAIPCDLLLAYQQVATTWSKIEWLTKVADRTGILDDYRTQMVREGKKAKADKLARGAVIVPKKATLPPKETTTGGDRSSS
jgi:hypothetical protein